MFLLKKYNISLISFSILQIKTVCFLICLKILKKQTYFSTKYKLNVSLYLKMFLFKNILILALSFSLLKLLSNQITNLLETN